MEGATEKDCSPLWILYQQIVTDMKNSTPMWEEFISKATKLHSALKSALGAIAAFLDAFQKIADAATGARGATKEIGTALTRVCLRHRAIETRMKTFISELMDSLITPLTACSDEWRRSPLGREHARECKRARSELRRSVTEAQRGARKARRAPPADQRKAEVCLQEVQEKKQQLEELEEKAVRAALVEERGRFCQFVNMLSPVVEAEVAMMAEGGRLQEGAEQASRLAQGRALPPASLQVVSDARLAGAAGGSPGGSRLGSRRGSLTSLCSVNTNAASTSSLSCSTPLSAASPAETHDARGAFENHISLLQWSRRPGGSSDSGFRSQEGLHRQLSLYVDNGSDDQSASSEAARRAVDDDPNADGLASAASATWPELADAAQFARAAAALASARPHTISAAYERGHPRAALTPHTFSSHSPRDLRDSTRDLRDSARDLRDSTRDLRDSSKESRDPRDGSIYARPPLPTRCSSLERPAVPSKMNCNITQQDFKHAKPSSLPPHLAKEVPAVYANTSELASLATPQEKIICSESSASESSLESSSGYGSQGGPGGAQGGPNGVPQASGGDELPQPPVYYSLGGDPSHESYCSTETVECEVVTLRRITTVKPVPRPRPLSLAASSWSRRGSSTSLSRPPPPVRRSSSISRPRPHQSPNTDDCSDLPPPPAFLLQPENFEHQNSVAETIKQLTELKHMPASPSAARRQSETPHAHAGPAPLSSFAPRVEQRPLYGHTGFKLQQEKQFGIYAAPAQINTERRPSSGLIASLSAKLAPQLSPRSVRRAPPSGPPVGPHGAPAAAPGGPNGQDDAGNRGKPQLTASVQPGFLNKLSATIQQQQEQQRRRNDSTRAATVREIINAQAMPDPTTGRASLLEQIRRGAALRRAPAGLPATRRH